MDTAGKEKKKFSDDIALSVTSFEALEKEFQQVFQLVVECRMNIVYWAIY